MLFKVGGGPSPDGCCMVRSRSSATSKHQPSGHGATTAGPPTPRGEGVGIRTITAPAPRHRSKECQEVHINPSHGGRPSFCGKGAATPGVVDQASHQSTPPSAPHRSIAAPLTTALGQMHSPRSEERGEASGGRGVQTGDAHATRDAPGGVNRLHGSWLEFCAERAKAAAACCASKPEQARKQTIDPLQPTARKKNTRP